MACRVHPAPTAPRSSPKTKDCEPQNRSLLTIHSAEIVRSIQLQFVGRRRRWMREHRFDCRRKARDLAGPVRKQRGGGHEQARLALALRIRLQQQKQREDLNGLAEPHVIGETGPEPQLTEQIKPFHADVLIRPQGTLQRLAWIDASSHFGPAQRGQRPGQPWTGHRLAQAASGAAAAPSPCIPAPAIIRIASPNDSPALAARCWMQLELLEHSGAAEHGRSRPIFRGMNASPSDCASSCLISAGGKSFALQRDLHLEIEQRVHAQLRRRPAADRRCYHRSRGPIHAPLRWHANYQNGRFKRRNVA